MGSPKDIADAARDDALEALADAAEMSDVKQHAAEQEAIADFADEMADALLDGLVGSQTSPYAAILAKKADYYNKSDIRGEIQSAVEAKENAGKKDLAELLRNDLAEVVVVRTTDHKQGTTYRWHFDPDDAPKFQVETHHGKDGRGHFAWSNFRDLVLEAGGVNVAKPPEHLQDGEEWREFVVEILDKNGRTVTTEGPRTRAVQSLANHVKRATGYNTVKDAIERDGVYVAVESVDVPEWWGGFAPQDTTPDLSPDVVNEIGVPGHLITRVADNQNVTERALQVELDARGYTLPKYGGRVSQSNYLNGENHTYWALSPELAVPEVYEPNPESAATQAQTKPAPENTADTPPAEPATDGGATETGQDTEDTDDGGFDGVGDFPGGDGE